MRFLAKDKDGRPVAILEAEDKIEAEIYCLRGNVKRYHSLASLNESAKEQGAADSQLKEAFKRAGLTDAQAELAAQGRRPVDPATVQLMESCLEGLGNSKEDAADKAKLWAEYGLPVTKVPRQGADPRFASSGTVQRLSERAAGSGSGAYEIEIRESMGSVVKGPKS